MLDNFAPRWYNFAIKPIESDRETDSVKSQQPKIVLGAKFRGEGQCF